jgi:hypothetical protein
VGIDSNPVAVAISEAKLSDSNPSRIVSAARRILESDSKPNDIPYGDFWKWAFHPDVLRELCILREGLRRNCNSPTRKALRAIILGALHGPRNKGKRSYLSNQCPRTYAPKPNYSIGFWRERKCYPEKVDIIEIIEDRAKRYYSESKPAVAGKVICGDSRNLFTFAGFQGQTKAKWVITSPPYYGMRTYLSDQWLRLWFVGAEPHVTYHSKSQLPHTSREVFVEQLGKVWSNLRHICCEDAKLIIRFGSINDRKVPPIEIIKESLKGNGWKFLFALNAGSADHGRRQALHFTKRANSALDEYDIWAKRW